MPAVRLTLLIPLSITTGCLLFSAFCGVELDPVQIAVLCQRAENTFVGVNCGILDQYTSAAGQAGHALLLNCRSLEVTPVPLPTGVALLVLGYFGSKLVLELVLQRG